MSFDLVAPHYRWLETIVFGNALHRSRIYWIDKIIRPKRALIVGEGNGRFLCDLLEVHPGIEIDCVDASPVMIHLARSRLRRKCPESVRHVRFFCEDILNWSASKSYDLLVTHFFFDCFTTEQSRKIIGNLSRSAQPNTVWLIADFTMPAQRVARAYTRSLLRVMYACFRVTAGIAAKELVDPFPLLTANGFVHDSSKGSHGGMLRSDLLVCGTCTGNNQIAERAFV